MKQKKIKDKFICRSFCVGRRQKIKVFFFSLFTLILLLSGSAAAQFLERDTVTIAASDDSSYTFDLDGNLLVGIEFPATFQGGTVSLMTGPHPDSTLKTVQYDGSDFSLTATDGKQCGMPPWEVNQLQRYIIVVSDSTESAIRLLWIISQ